MRAAEGGEEVVERVFVSDVDGGEVEVGLEALLVEEVVFADGDIEQVARGDARRVMVVVFGAGSRNLDELGGVSCRVARSKSSIGNGGRNAVAGEAGFELLVGCEAAQVDSRDIAGQGNGG